MQTLPASSIELLQVGEIVNLNDLVSLSGFEFVNLLERRWVYLDKKIKSCTTGDSSWNDFQLWRSEKQEIDEIIKMIQV